MEAESTMGRESILQALRLFNEKAEKLAGNTFTTRVFGEDSGVTIHWSKGEPLTVQRRGPNQESIEVFALTLRFFMQDNEGCSLRNVARLYEDALVAAELKERFREVRQELNLYLDSPGFLVNTPDTRLTRREVLNTFLYGALAHANPDMKERYDRWMSYGSLFEVQWNALVVVLADFMQFIVYIHDLNAQVIIALGEVP